MLKTYLKIAFLSIRKNKLTTGINVIGFAVSLSCFLLILLWVLNQLNYDRFFKNYNQIYRVNTDIKERGISVLSVENAAPVLKTAFPEIVNSCRVFPFKKDIVVRYGNKEFIESNEISVDSNFFELFSYELKTGSRKYLLNNPDKIVITEEVASKIFGNSNPIGKILTLNPGSHKRELIISGVIKNPPENSHLKFNYVTLLTNLPFWGNGWEYTDVISYVQLSDSADQTKFEKKLKGFIKQFNKNSTFELKLQPLKDIHLYSNTLQDASIFELGDVKYVYIFAVTALLVLILASANFVNLSLAADFKRIKEASIKKILGAKKYHLILQYLCESVLSVLFSAFIALILIEIMLPAYNHIFDSNLKINFFDYKYLLGFLLIVLFIGILSGTYPAFIFSSMNPFEVLQNNFNKNFKISSVKKLLVILQFTLSIGMIISVLIIKSQLEFIQKKNLGFNKERIIYFTGHGLPADPKPELLRLSSVQNVTWTSELPISVQYELQGTTWEGRKDDNLKLHYLMVDYDFLKTFDIQIKEGRGFSKEFQADKYNYILNETAAKQMNLGSPLGNEIVCLSGLGSRVPGRIIGIVKDFHFNSLHNKIEPLVLGMYIGKPWYVSVKIKSGNLNQTISQLEKSFKRVNPSSAFDFNFLDETFQSQYIAETRLSKVFEYFTLFIIFISCMGLFGLISISIEQNIKEIGIRKVLGASVPSILLMLSKEFIKWIIIANIIAWPIAWYAMNNWLQDFAYRTELTWWMFALAGGIALVIALITISFQAIKAATANPVESLRYE